MAATQERVLKQGESPLLDEYLDFLDVHRGLSKATIYIRSLYVAPFLVELDLCKTVEMISASRIHDYVIKTARSMTRPSRKHLVSSLRSFLRFAHVRGHTRQNLADAVPVITTRKLDRVPRGIAWESVQKLLSSPRRDTDAGRSVNRRAIMTHLRP